MLRQRARQDVLQVIKKHNLTEHAFTVNFETKQLVNSQDPFLADPFNPTSTQLLSIVCVLNPAWTFSARKSGNGFVIESIPGSDLLILQTRALDDFHDILEALKVWLDAVEEEEFNTTNADAIAVAKLKADIFKYFDEQIPKKDSFFTAEEGEKLRCKIDELEQKLEQLLSAQASNKELVNTVVAKLESAKEDTKKMTKKNWLIIGVGKIFEAFKEFVKTPEGRALAVEEIKKLTGLP